MHTRRISVVIPAHNESNVIERCLENLLSEAEAGELEILVVCNGCTDATAKLARRFGKDVRVLESASPSKNAALNLGDQAATVFPRFFVDADIVLTTTALRSVANVLRGGLVLGAAPRMEVDLTNRSWAIRAFYTIWLRTPYVTSEMLGCGVYAISESGRERFDRFPDIIADDCFVRLLFEPNERRCVRDVSFLMTPPETLRALIHINVRRQVGMDEMAQRYPDSTRRERTNQLAFLFGLMRQPTLWPSLMLYLGAKAATLAIYYYKKLVGRQREWNRDDTSRSRT